MTRNTVVRQRRLRARPAHDLAFGLIVQHPDASPATSQSLATFATRIAAHDRTWSDIAVERAPKVGPVAAGGDLDAARVYSAYRHGLYPVLAWDEEKLAQIESRFGAVIRSGRVTLLQPERRRPLELTWLSPDPRPVVGPTHFREASDIRFALRRGGWTSTVDRAFADVVRACRDQFPKTWLVPEMIETYEELHRHGLAHSVEVWDGDQLVGGTYGVLTGRVFSVESAFHRVNNAGKAVYADLARRLALSGVLCYDCQEFTPFQASVGATQLRRACYLQLLRRCRDMTTQLFAAPMALRDWEALSVGG